MASDSTQPIEQPSCGESSLAFPEALERVRTRLLDLTLSNRLINFRHSKRSSLRVVDELPDVLWNRLCDGDELLFIPVPEPVPVADSATGSAPTAKQHAETLGLASSFELPEPPASGDKPKAAHRDNKIQTLLYPSELDACLRTIASSARSAIEETGTNMLHLVFGFLDWTQSDAPDKRMLAPLVTLPVTLRRGDVDPRTRTYRFHVAHSGEDVAANLSLQEKLRRDFGIHLPAFGEDETPEAYFQRVFGGGCTDTGLVCASSDHAFLALLRQALDVPGLRPCAMARRRRSTRSSSRSRTLRRHRPRCIRREPGVPARRRSGRSGLAASGARR